MKKSAKKNIVSVLLLFLMFALIVLAYVGIKKKCELGTKEKVLAEEELNSEENRRVSLLAQFQMLTAEERITSIASNELGMIKRTEAAAELKVDARKIEQISKVLKEKYE